MAAYFIMGLLSSRFFSDYFSKPVSIIIVSLCFCSLYGATDEWHQSYIPGREADIADWLADIAGATLALIFLQLSKKINTRTIGS